MQMERNRSPLPLVDADQHSELALVVGFRVKPFNSNGLRRGYDVQDKFERQVSHLLSKKTPELTKPSVEGYEQR